MRDGLLAAVRRPSHCRSVERSGPAMLAQGALSQRSGGSAFVLTDQERKRTASSSSTALVSLGQHSL